MPDSNQTAAPKSRWPWWLGGLVLLAVAGVLTRFIGRTCCGSKTGQGKEAEEAIAG